MHTPRHMNILTHSLSPTQTGKHVLPYTHMHADTHAPIMPILTPSHMQSCTLTPTCRHTSSHTVRLTCTHTHTQACTHIHACTQTHAPSLSFAAPPPSCPPWLFTEQLSAPTLSCFPQMENAEKAGELGPGRNPACTARRHGAEPWSLMAFTPLGIRLLLH